MSDSISRPFAIEHVELELRVAEPHQRLAFGHDVARLGEHALDAAAFQRIEIDRVERDDIRHAMDEVVKGRLLDGGDGDLRRVDAQRALRTSHEQQRARDDEHEHAGAERDARPRAALPPGALDGKIHRVRCDELIHARAV